MPESDRNEQRADRRWGRPWLGLLLLAIWLGACGPTATRTPSGAEASATNPAPPIPLEDTEWLLSSLQGAGPIEGSKPTMSFYADEYLEGSAGCNTFGTDYVTSGHAFEVSVIHRTRFECDEPVGIAEWEAAFFAALEAISSYRATEERLEFEDASGEIILAYVRKWPAVVDVALQGTGWTLTTLRDEAPLKGTTLTLYLQPEGFEGYAGCNHYGGEYEATGEGVLDFGLFAITEMDCPTPEGVLEQEQAYVQVLQDVTGYRLEGDRLELHDADGSAVATYARQGAGEGRPADLLGTVWQLVSMDGQSPLPGSRITLAFKDEQLTSGHAGCRDYVATYKTEDSQLRFEYFGMLGEVCPGDPPGQAPSVPSGQAPDEGLMEQEGLYTTILGWTNRYRLDEGRLELSNIRGETLLFEPLPGEAQASLADPTWLLLAFVEPNPYVEGPERWPMPAPILPGTEITALFEEGGVRGSAGCNDYGGTVRLDGASLSVGEIVSTEMYCSNPPDAEVPEGAVMEQERRYFEFLRAVTRVGVLGQQLWLETDDERALVFRPEP